VPILARGANQKPPNHVHKSVVFTVDRVRAYRDAIDGPHATMDFRRHIMPFIQAEIDHSYLTALVREAHGAQSGDQFAARHAELIQAGQPTDELLREFAIAEGTTLDLEALGRPFTKMSFESPAQFHAGLLDLMRTDIADAMRGNVDGPIKAALDILRDIRNTIRDLVDYGGLEPSSHRDDFLGWYVPINSLLSAGPPVERVEQLVALIEAGIVTIIGPRADFSIDTAKGAFVISSPVVAGGHKEASVLIDARIPQPNLHADLSPLYHQLVADGLAREFVINATNGSAAFHTGGLEVTRAPFNLVDRAGHAVPGLFALGLPTEHLRWFTQVGSGRPGLNTLFRRDADAIAQAVLAGNA
jgi:methylaspartate mutase epsilon subunit